MFDKINRIISVTDYHDFFYLEEIFDQEIKEIGFCINFERPYIGLMGLLDNQDILTQLGSHSGHDGAECDIVTKFFRRKTMVRELGGPNESSSNI